MSSKDQKEKLSAFDSFSSLSENEKQDRISSNKISSSSSSAIFWQEVFRVLKGKKGDSKQNKGHSNFKDSFIKIYGLHWNQNATIRELNILSKNNFILDEIEAQKAFTRTYLANVLDIESTNGTLRRVIAILIKRKLLFSTSWTGQAKATFGMLVYFTLDAAIDDIEATLYDYKVADELRYRKELQRQKKKKSKTEKIKSRLEDFEATREASKIYQENKPLTTQDQAKIFLTADKIKTGNREADFQLKLLLKHTKTCKDCKYSKLCFNGLNIRNRYNQSLRSVTKTIASQPDRINKPALNENQLDNFEYLDKAKQLIDTEQKQLPEQNKVPVHIISHYEQHKSPKTCSICKKGAML